MPSLYNNIQFKPSRIQTVRGDVTFGIINTLNPCHGPYGLDAEKLKCKCYGLSSEYENCPTKFRGTGQGVPDTYFDYTNKTYAMYAFCFFCKDSILNKVV